MREKLLDPIPVCNLDGPILHPRLAGDTKLLSDTL
jgi:hypothetical protein